MSSNFFDQFDTDSPPQNFFDQFDTEAPGSQKETGPFLASGAPETAPRPVARPRVSGFAAALEEDPASPAPKERPFVSRRNPRDIRGPGTAEEQTYQGPADLGRRFARGATEIAAGLPEAAAIAGFGNRNASALFAAEEVQRAREQIQAAEQRLAEYPDMSDADRQNIESIIDAERRKVSAYEPLIETADGPLKPEAQDRGLYKRGDQLRAASEELFGSPDEEFDDRFVSKLAEGAGSMAGFVAATLATGVVGGAGVGAASNSSQMYREARDEGATEEQAKTAAFLGSMVGASEVIPIGRALDLLPSELRGRVANAIGKRLSNAFLTAGEEGAQEALTQISNNLIAQGVWDSQRGTLDGAGEAALIGAVLGGGLGAVAGGGRDPDRLESPRLTDADRASPLPNDVIDDGKAIIDDLLKSTAPGPLQVPERTDKSPEAPTQSAEPEASSASPAQPEEMEAEILPVIGADGQETGAFVRVNPVTGQIEKVENEAPVIAPIDSLPKPEAAPTPSIEEAPAAGVLPAAPLAENTPIVDGGQRVAPTAPVAPEAPQPVQVQPPRKPTKPTLQKRPVAQELKTRGLSVKPGSPLAEELKARGITPRTHPGLFNANGRTDWDNLPAAEWQDYRHELGEDGNGYLSQQGIIDALETEMRGAPVQVGEQADLQAAADAKEAEARFSAAEPDPEEIDLSHIPEAQAFITRPEEDISTPTERIDFVVRNVDTVLAETGIAAAVPPQMRQEIITVLNDRGGNVEDAIWWNLHKKADGHAQQTAQPRVADQSPDGQAARSGGPAYEVSGDLGRSEEVARAEDGSPAVDQNDRRADVGQAEEPPAPEVNDPVPSVGVRAVEPAPLPSIPKDLPKPKALPETRGQGQRFHGSSAPIERLEEGFYTSQNYYGQGFYTSDAIDIVDGYARRNKQDGNVYQIAEIGEVKAFDMEQPVPDFVVKAYRDLPDYSTVKEIIEIGLLDNAGSVDAASVREMYDRIREEADYSADTIQEAFEVLRETFVENGYNALDHIGGQLTKKKPHQVRIYLEPDKQVRVTEIDRNAPVSSVSPAKSATERTETEALASEAKGRDALDWVVSKARPFTDEDIVISVEAAKEDGIQPGTYSVSGVKFIGTVPRNMLRRLGKHRPLVSTPTEHETIHISPKKGRVEYQRTVYTLKEPAPATERTEAGEQAVIPGAEQSAERSAEARKADQRREMEVRQQQSKKRTAVPQDDAGPLFDTQGDMFDQPRADTAPSPAAKPKPSKTQDRLKGILRDAWTEREDLPDDASDKFLEATKRVQDARRALAEEFGDEAANAALVEIEAGYKPKSPEPVQERTDQERVKKERIEDFGEKIGGARKDLSEKTGPRPSKPKGDSKPAWRKRYEVNEIVADAFDKSKVGKWAVTDKKTGRQIRDNSRVATFSSREEAEAAIPFYEVAKNHRVRKTEAGFSIERVAGKRSHTFKDGFESREAAMDYMAKNAIEIIETDIRIDDRIHPALEQALREGEARRADGADVTPKDFTEVFGFRGVEFGNWNNGAERQHILNQAYDSFLDLSEILGVPPKAISLEGDLALAFGARGHGLTGGRAHYERNYGVINLTKIQGAGALSHEWMHAVDHYFGRLDGKAASKKITNDRGDSVFDAKDQSRDYASHGFQIRKSGVRPEVRDAFKAVMQAISKRTAEFKEDVSTREVIESRAGALVDKELNALRNALTREDQYARKKAPATKEQLLKIDTLIKQIKSGKLGEKVVAPSKSRSSFPPMFNTPVMKLAEIYQEVRGRQAYSKYQGRYAGPAVQIQHAVDAKIKADQFLAEAKEEKVKQKIVTTEFVSEAWKLDHGRANDYWATNHELIARAFESYVYDRLKDINARNDFLSYEKHNLLPEYQLLNVKPYPEGKERTDINEAFRTLFDVIQTEETDKGVRLYQAAAASRGHAPARRLATTFMEARAAVKEFQGKVIVNRDSGIEAVVSRNALDKMLSSKAVNSSETPETHSMAVANADALFENAIYGWVKPDNKGEPSIVGIHRLFARMDKPNGGVSMVKMTVKETVSDAKTNPLYTVEAVEFLEDGTSAATWVASALKSDGMKLPDILSAEALLNIAKDVEEINSTRKKSQKPAGRSADAGKLADLLPYLQERLKKLMIRGVHLSFDPEAEFQGATDIDANGEISILIGASLDGMNTLNHEAIHVLRSRRLFSDREWQTLTREAEATWVAKYDIEERYSDLGREAQIEEAIAEAFAEFASGRADRPSTFQKIFAKVKRFFRALKEALAGQGIREPEDIFTDVDQGAIGARDDGRVSPQELIAARNQSGAGRKRQAARRKTHIPSVQSLFGSASQVSIPDRRVWDEFAKSGNGFWSSIKGAAGAMHDKIDRARVQVQDRFLPVLRAQEAIERATGQAIPEQMNAYLAEETFSGKVGRHLFEIDEEFTKPIIDLIAETNGDMTVDTVGKWLTARHAKERNAYIASINDKMPDGGSGMTNAEADAVLRDVSSGKHAASYQKIGKMLDDLRERTMDLRVDAGLMTKRDAMLWRSQYKHYVPLKGFAETDSYDAYLNLQGVNARYTVKGQESQRALGRSSEAFNPLQAAITQAQEVAVRAEKNRVGRSLFDLASHHPSEALWEVKDVITKRYYNQTTGRVEEMAVDPASMRLEPNELAVKINGKEKRIIFHDPRLAAAAGTVGADQMGSIVRILSMASRYFSAVNTMLDPEFVIRNAFRDMTTAQINIRNFGKDDRNKIAGAMVKNWRKAFVAVYRGQANNADTEWTRYYREFEKAGGKVSFWKLDQPEAGKGDLERRVDLASGNRFIRVGKVLTSPRAFFSERDNAALAAVERVNISVDNAIRLAAFVAARKAGWSSAQAASLSKNLTVNFNRRGLKGPGLNAAYPFFNAAMQGSQILVRAMTSKRMAKYMVALVGYGVFEDMINAAISDEDDDGELAYDKIPDWKLEMNLVWMRSEGNATTLPLPYGYNVFPYLGKQIGKVARGVKEPGEAFGDVASAVFGAFSPMAMDQSENTGLNIVKLLSPMATDTLIELASNRDWLDRPIRPENPYGDYGPDAYKFYGGASEGAKTIADLLNRISGGNRSEAGAFDVSPEYIDHMTAFLTGGAGRFAGRAADMTAKLLSGDLDLIEGHTVPFVRSVNTGTGTWLDKDRYYRFRDEVREAVAAVKTEEETGEPVFFETKVKASLNGEVTIADRRLKKIRKEREAAGDKASPAQRKDWELREAEAVLAFNRKYIEKMGPQAE